MKNTNNHGMRWCGYISDIYLCILFSLYILICAPYSEITKTKFILFVWICGGYIALVVISVIELMLIGVINPRELKFAISRRKVIFIPAGVYILFTLISALTSPYDYDFITGHTRYEGVLTQLIYTGVFVTTSIFGKIKKHHIHILGVTGVLFSLLCIVQMQGCNPFMLYPNGYGYSDAYIAYPGEYLGTIGNADLVSGFLAVAVTLYLAYMLYIDDRIRYWLIIPFCLCTATLIMCRVSSGILATCITILLLVPHSLGRKDNKKLKYALIAEAAIVIIGLMYIYTNNFPVGSTLGEINSLLHGHADLSFGSHRFFIWHSILCHMPENLWLGTGPDSMALWNMGTFSKQICSNGQIAELIIDTAHNEYLNIAAQQGILCLGAYAVIIYTAVKSGFKHNNKSVFLVYPLIAYLIQAFFGFSMCITAPILWTLAGILLNKEEPLHNNDKSVQKNDLP